MAGRKDKKYLVYISEQKCMVYDCRRHPVISHHWRGGGEGGTGIKPDDTCTIPLCNDHHMELHNGGVITWGLENFKAENAEMLQLIIYKRMFELLSEYHFDKFCTRVGR